MDVPNIRNSPRAVLFFSTHCCTLKTYRYRKLCAGAAASSPPRNEFLLLAAPSHPRPARAHICRRSDNINNSINTSRNARALAAIGVPRALAGDSITITISISIASALGGAIHGDISVAAPRGDGGRVRPPLHRPLHGLRSRPCNRRRRAPHRVRRHDCRLRAQIQGIKQIKSTKKLQEGRRQTKRSFCNNRWKCKFMTLCRAKYTPNAQNCNSDISSTCNTYAARACVLRLRQGKTYEDPIKRMLYI